MDGWKDEKTNQLLQSPLTNIGGQIAVPLIKENSCAKLFPNPCVNVRVMAHTSLIYDHVII